MPDIMGSVYLWLCIIIMGAFTAGFACGAYFL